MSPIVGWKEFCDWVLYDEVRFGPSLPLTRQLFSIPVGQTEYHPQADVQWESYVKTFLHTNSLMAGMLDSPCEMQVSRLNVLFLTRDRPLRIFETSAYRNTTVQLAINRKIYWESPAWQCASPFALFDTPKEEIVRLGEKYGIDWKQIGASFDFHPLTINVQEYFTVRVQMSEDPEEELFCHVYLDGIEGRAII